MREAHETSPKIPGSELKVLNAEWEQGGSNKNHSLHVQPETAKALAEHPATKDLSTLTETIGNEILKRLGYGTSRVAGLTPDGGLFGVWVPDGGKGPRQGGIYLNPWAHLEKAFRFAAKAGTSIEKGRQVIAQAMAKSMISTLAHEAIHHSVSHAAEGGIFGVGKGNTRSVDWKAFAPEFRKVIDAFGGVGATKKLSSIIEQHLLARGADGELNLVSLRKQADLIRKDWSDNASRPRIRDRADRGLLGAAAEPGRAANDAAGLSGVRAEPGRAVPEGSGRAAPPGMGADPTLGGRPPDDGGSGSRAEQSTVPAPTPEPVRYFTDRQKQQLRDRGLTDQDIADTDPQTLHRLLTRQVDAREERLRRAEQEGNIDRAERGEPLVPGVKLARETVETWPSLQPEVQKKVRTWTDEQFEAQSKKGEWDASTKEAWDHRVKGKDQTSSELNADYLAKAEKSKQSGSPDDYQAMEGARLKSMAARADFVKAVSMQLDDNAGTGRALSILNKLNEIKGSPSDAMLRRIFKEVKGISEEQAGELLRIHDSGDLDAFDRALHSQIKPGFWPKFIELWKNGLVSAIGTQIPNIAGNVLESGVRAVETPVSAWIENKVARGLGKEATRRPLMEVKAELSGAMHHVPQAFRQLGTDLMAIAKMLPEQREEGRSLEYQTGAIGSGGKVGEAIGQVIPGFHAGRAVRAPFRLLGAFDKFFKVVGAGADTAKFAFQQASKELGLKAPHSEVQARAQQLIEDTLNPDGISPEGLEILRRVKDSVLERVYQNKPPAFAESISNFRAAHPWMHAVFPFTQTPANILRLAVQRSPFGIPGALKEFRAARAGGNISEAAAAMARPLVGSAIFGGFVAAALQGKMTGAGPTDPKERNLLLETGWQPYSFKTSDGKGGFTYIPYNRMEPLATMLGAAADFNELKETEADQVASKFIGIVAANLLDKTYLSGLKSASGVINDPIRSGGQYVSGLAGSLVPNIVTKAAQAIDPTMRDTRPPADAMLGGFPRRVLNTIESRIPGMSQDLPARVSAVGTEIERPGNALSRFISPSQISSTSSKPHPELAKLQGKLKIAPDMSPRSIKSNGIAVPLTPEEREIMTAAYSKAAKDLDGMTRSPGFQQLPLTEEEGGSRSQEGYLRARYNAAREEGRHKILQSSEFHKRYMKMRKGHGRPAAAAY